MTNYQIKITLPDDVMDNLPSNPAQWESYLAKFLQGGDLQVYDASLQRRQQGSVLGKPLSRYERSICTDLLLDIILGQLREARGMRPTTVETYAEQTA